MEQTSIQRLSLLHPKIKDDAIAAYTEAVKITPTGVHPFITQTLRTFKESNDLYALGRTVPGKIVTNAKAGQSYHNYGLALDFCLQVDGNIVWKVDKNWMLVVSCFKKYGFSWGGDWKGNLKDYPHIDKTFGINWRKMLAKHEAKDFIKGTEFINI